MCTKNQLNIITSAVADEARQILGSKLDAVVLYGSYARGDFDDESDIDIMVRIDCPANQLDSYEDSFDMLSSRLSLDNDITVSITLRDKATFNRFMSALPFYSNIEREGIKIAWWREKGTIKIKTW